LLSWWDVARPKKVGTTLVSLCFTPERFEK